MKWYEKTWFTWLTLIIFPPLGIFLLWKYRDYTPKTKKILTVVFAIWLVFSVVNSNDNKQNSPQEAPATQTVQQEEKLPDDVKAIQDETKLTAEQSKQVAEVLKQCGFDEFTIKYDSTLDNIAKKDEKGYVLTYKDMAPAPEILMSITPDGNVYQIIYNGNYIYNNGAVQSKIQDYYISIDDQSKLIAQTQLIIDKCLKAPKTAEYQLPNEWRIKKTSDSVRVSAYVDADNSFGAKLRNDFTVTYSSDLKTVKSVILNGTEYMQ